MKFTSTVAESGLLSESLGIFLENGGYDLHHLRRLYERQIDAVRACIAEFFKQAHVSAVLRQALFYGLSFRKVLIRGLYFMQPWMKESCVCQAWCPEAGHSITVFVWRRILN